MNKSFVIIRFVLRIVAFLAAQILLFNDLSLFDLARPFIYLAPLMMLPIRVVRWQGLLLAFSIGLTVDIFSYSLGIHAAATVFMFYIRDFLLHNIIGLGEEFEGMEPHADLLGIGNYLLYIGIMVFTHHLLMLLLDRLSVFHFADFILSLFVNTFFTILILLITEMLFYYRGRKR